jgi:O-antigen biosynthesis protein
VTSVSVVIPVKDGGPLLGMVLSAVRAQGDVELLVIDSGSRDRSRQVARAAGATLIEIAPDEFAHGRTRNLGAERSSGELICFLTQDAVPEPGWLAAHREAFQLDERVGAAFGPHLPRPDSSPMVARELVEFFERFSPSGGPVIHRVGDLTFLSNVNACYARSCWEEIRFPEIDYAEDQAFGRAMLEAGWVKVFHPDAAVRHAHDYGPVEFMKRYFDEYRGLREASGHIEPLAPRAAVREVRGDQRWMREQGWTAGRRLRWLPRSAIHHGGRRAASALGSRANRLPGRIQSVLSLERRESSASDSAPRGRQVAARQTTPFSEVLRLSREGPVPLDEPIDGMSERLNLHIAVVIPPFQRGSGGHNTICTLVARLEEMGHTCSIWLHDPKGRERQSAAVLRREIVDHFVPVRAPVFKGFDDWYGADVAVATGWETAFATVLLPGCRARVYLINDHEPEFFDTSAEAIWAARTYQLGLYGISASRWLRDLVARKYGQRGTWFRLGVNHLTYHPRRVERRDDTVIFYAREFSGRRAVPLGSLALEELHSRRADTRFVLFGQVEEASVGVPYELLGVASPEVLALRYSKATVGLCLSLTNYSLIPQEMMACGLPVVDLAGGSTESELGRESGVEFAEPDPVAIADALELLLNDAQARDWRATAGLGHVQSASWDVAARQVEAGLREALRHREHAIEAPVKNYRNRR